jgi:RNA polymerase sigma factor (sigma-70 family)
MATHSGNSFACFDAEVADILSRNARRLIGRRGFTASDLADIEQHLAAELWRSMSSYDPSAGPFACWAATIVRNAARTLARRQKAQRRDWRRTGPSLSSEARDGGSLASSLSHDGRRPASAMPAAGQHSAVDNALDLEAAIAALTPEQRAICELLKEAGKNAVAKRLGIGRSSFYGQIETIRKRFESRGITGKIF